jgi:hypothetical protein
MEHTSSHDGALIQAHKKPINKALLHHNLDITQNTIQQALGGATKESKKLSREGNLPP